MAALVSYGSSDEEDNLNGGTDQNVDEGVHASTSYGWNGIRDEIHQEKEALEKKESSKHHEPLTRQAEPDVPQDAPVLGPTIPTDMAGGLPELMDDDQEPRTAPQSPYSANRALLRDLTLPTTPNYDIPASPPGSPVASTNAKFKHFLELKRQGVHFNEKLARSSAVKNPSLMQKLMDFSDIDEVGQYSTTLSKDIWDPVAFPEYAYKEELAKSQQKILKRKEEEKTGGRRETVDFVSSSISGESLSRSVTPGIGGKPSQKSAAERVMAGLASDRGASSSPQVQGIKRKSRFDS
ncbi:HCNGP-domain-containing protein [Venustampulla echinocandica]|uniref:HCNGP-domain-containing protein n=1 Tax=Venustampulla echinocandica TaxID=2656787 RepID=A0A370THF5_9HELO|nr:HCNGP-domain-containing protein [Venustampulla echinocandica]RDL34618.1 HCNGP-domain-containing protein [Venustampulla echinocandica]